MPSQPMAIWKTPCSSRKVQSAGISTRRHTIGLTSLSQSFSCRMEPEGGGEDARARFAKGQSRGDQRTSLRGYAASRSYNAPHFRMLSGLRTPPLRTDDLLGFRQHETPSESTWTTRQHAASAPQERPERQRANAHGGPSKPKG